MSQAPLCEHGGVERGVFCHICGAKRNTLFDRMRANLHARAGLHDAPKKKLPSLAELEKSEWSDEFEQLMRNRLVMGALRYGTFAEKAAKAKKGDHWKLLEALESKLKGYEETGNTEHLVDAANYLMLAYLFDPHPKKHFRAIDDTTDHCQK